MRPFRPIRAVLITAALAAACATLLHAQSAAGARQQFALDTVKGLRPHNVTFEPATLEGRKGVRVTVDKPMSAANGPMEQLAIVEGVEFGNGVIEAEIAGAPAPNAPEGARGFVGIAFRLQSDLKTYDAFYLRPTNGRAEDQERRNHATQYISHPDWPWNRLRKETPSRYESYVDVQPGVWTKVKIEVRGDKARLYVNEQPQPVLLVNDVKTGATAKGGVALWIDSGTVAHFRNLTVAP